MEWIRNKFKNTKDALGSVEGFSAGEIHRAYLFHKSMPEYEETPLHELTGTAQVLGVNALFIKDESTRFGLNAFKGLGVSYAMAQYFAGRQEQGTNDIPFNELMETISDSPPATFATATEGNHGKGVAWGTKIFNQKGKVFLPKGAAKNRVEAVTALGAEAEVTDMNYDDTVQHVAELAKQKGWILMQDTAWEGYTEIPLNIMRGYATIISEIKVQLGQKSLEEVSHIILQAGVGSFAGAMAAALHTLTDGKLPKIIIVEPAAANPLFRSAASAGGEPIRVHGDMETVMAGLSCGAPSLIGWNILKPAAEYFISCHDRVSDKGMRLLGRPAGEDPVIISGASGALPLGFLHEVMTDEAHSDLKGNLGLGEDSKVLIINTEGNTDPNNRKRVMKE